MAFAPVLLCPRLPLNLFVMSHSVMVINGLYESRQICSFSSISVVPSLLGATDS